jgi:hypothetical protein
MIADRELSGQKGAIASLKRRVTIANPMKPRGDRTLKGRMSDRKHSEGLWAIARWMGVGRSHIR